MLSVLIVVAVCAYLLSKITTVDVRTDTLDTLIAETHPYSGIHEASYTQFYAHIRLARAYRTHTTQARAFLHEAIGFLNDIPMYMSPIDPDVQGEIAMLGHKITVAFERILLDETMNHI